MEAIVISFAALLLLLVVGGAMLYSGRREERASTLEPPAAPPAVEEAIDALKGVPDEVSIEPEVVAPPVEESFVQPTEEKPRFRDRLGKARGLFGEYLGGIRGRGAVDQATWDDLEEALIRADVGVATTTALLDELRDAAKAEGIKSPEALIEVLKADLKKRLAQGNRDLRCEPGEGPNVWLFVGVNGVGKTTTIGKVGLRYANDGKAVVMAAGDTFRAAAAEQLTVWAERANAEVVRGQEGGDPGSVIFDAIERANARDADLVLADTAGRLHNKSNLMEELKKVKRISERPPARLNEILLVLDATTGQNGLTQARIFSEAVDCTGVVLTKLDGTAKGGIALAIQTELGLPIKLVGLGESNVDLIDFDPDEFVDALFE